MAIFNGRLTEINKEEMIRYAGLRQAKNFPSQYIDRACEEIQILANPKGIYQVYDYDATTHTILSTPPLKLEGKSIQKHLASSNKVYVLGVTIGETVEQESAKFFKDGEYTLGLLLDAAATTAVEQVADQVNEIIDNLAHKAGYTTTWRFSPGYGDWPLTVQKELGKIIKAEQINLSVTENFLLFPRKSVTAIIGCQEGSEETPTKRGCSSCTQINCTSRKT